MKKWLGRIGEGLVFTIGNFIIISILNKLLAKYDDWLYRSLVLAVPYVFAIPIKYYGIVDKRRKKWPVVIFTTLFVGIITLFITGVCLPIEDYWWQTFYITFFFGWAMIFAPIDKEADKKREYKKNKPKDTFNGDIVV